MRKENEQKLRDLDDDRELTVKGEETPVLPGPRFLVKMLDEKELGKRGVALRLARGKSRDVIAFV